MKQIKTMTKEELLMGSVDLISKTYINLGIRGPINGDFIHLNVPVYMKWLRKHKDLIWDARARVDKGESPKQVPYYRPEPKLLR